MFTLRWLILPEIVARVTPKLYGEHAESRIPSAPTAEQEWTVTAMAKYTERKTNGVQLREIDAVDVAIVLRLLETKKLTKAQWVAVRRLLSAYYSTD